MEDRAVIPVVSLARRSIQVLRVAALLVWSGGVFAQAAPGINSFTPTSGPVGTVITVTGTNLSNASTPAWLGNAHDAALTNVNSTTVQVTVPADSPVGTHEMAIFTAGGTAFSSTDFTTTAAATPIITSFTPTTGPVGTVITVTGTNLTGATAASVGAAQDATVTNVNSTTLQISVPSDAAIGADQLGLVYSSGTILSSSNFTVTATPAPGINSFTPTSGPVGTVITVTGTNLSNATTLAWLGNAHDAPLTNVNSTTVQVTVPADSPAGTHQMAIFTPGGTAFSGTDFTTTAASTPTITSFSPSSGPATTIITFTGTNLTGVTQGWVGSGHDGAIYNDTATSVQIAVPADAPAGADQLALVFPSGTVYSATNFTVTTPPTISSFTPTSGPVGTVITVTGTNFSNATSPAWVGSAHDAVLTNVSSTTVEVTVPADAPVQADQLNIITTSGDVFSSSNFTVTASAQGPTTPTGLTATAASSTQINLSWTASTDPAGVTGYVIQSCQGASCSSFTQIGSVTGTVTTYSNTALTASTSYSYRIQATDAAGHLSSYSSVSTTSTPAAPDTQPPTSPTGLGATTVSATQINLSWTASTDNVGVSGYRVERCSGASCTSFAQIGTPTASTYTDTGLTGSTSYSYRVRATDAAGNLSGYSSTATASTQSSADTQPPTAPTGLGATPASSSQINLSWNASTDNVGVTGYRVERCVGAGCTTFGQIGTPTATSYSDQNLTAGTSYSYRVRATDVAANLSGYSTVAIGVTSGTAPIGANSVTYGYDQAGRLTSAIYSTGASTAYTLDAAGNRTLLATNQLPAPSAPTNLTLNSDSAVQVIFSWTASTTSGVTGYQVFRNGVAIGSQTPPSATTYTDNSVVASTPYSYTVVAYVATFPSSPSLALLVTPPAIAAPLAPTGLAATAIGYSQVSLTWTAPNDSGPGQPGIQGYHIYRNGTELSLTSATNSVQDTTASSGTYYSYTVSAYDNAGRLSPQSVAAPVTTLYQILTPSGTVVPAAQSTYSTQQHCTPQGGGCNGTNLYQTYGVAENIAYSPVPCTSTDVTIRVTGYSVASDCSVQAPASVYFYPILPSTPASFAATVNSYSQITLSWASGTLDTGGPGIQDFAITRNGVALTPAGALTTSFVDSGLTPNTQYTYTIATVDKSNVSSITATAIAPTPAIVPPPPPQGLLGAAVSSSEIKLTWSAPIYSGGAGIKNYTVLRSFEGSPAAPIVGSPTTATSISDMGLALGTSYTYTVSTVDYVNETSGAATVIVATNGDTTKPSAPGVPTVSNIGGTTVTATWSAATDNVGVTNYSYQVTGPAGSTAWTNVGNVLTANVTGLLGVTSYTVSVRANDLAGNIGPTATSASFKTGPYSDVSTMTIGGGISDPAGGGFRTDAAYGSMSPATTVNGYTYYSLYTRDAAGPGPGGGGTGPGTSTLVITGFTADPGQSWLTSATAAGTTATAASASSYSYSAGAATWQWGPLEFNFAASGTTICTIVHN